VDATPISLITPTGRRATVHPTNPHATAKALTQFIAG
jgi:hypothetical protein